MDTVQLPDANLQIPSPEVVAFCEEKDITDEVARTVELAKRCFRTDKTALRVVGDPESCWEWLVVDVFAPGSVEEVLADYTTFKKLWMADIPKEKQFFIRTLYNFSGRHEPPTNP